jgi:hypothetical protein
MKFRKSISIANSFFTYLPFLALTGIWIISDSTRHSMLWLVIPFIILFVIVYGRIVEIIKNSNKSSWHALVARHLVNYSVVTIILILPTFVLSFVDSHMNYMTKLISKNVIGALTSCLTVYVWPLVFIEQQTITAITKGIRFLFHNLRQSVFLVLLSLSIPLIKMLISLSIPFFIYPPDNFQIIFGIGFLQNLFLTYIDLLIFAMATIFVLKKKKND